MEDLENACKTQYIREDFRDFAHTAPGTLAGRFMRRFWHPVWVADELAPGRAKSVKLMGEEFTLYRGEGGRLHAVGHRCPHRGTMLSIGWVEGDEIRCLYHGWKYDETGQCVEQPGESDDGKGFAHKVKIPSYPVKEYLGLIFVYIGEGGAPPLPTYPQFEDEGVFDVYWYVRKCNYFQNIENTVDEAHVPFTHRVSSFTDAGLNRDVPFIEAEETEYGIIQTGKRKDGVKRVKHVVMPNVIHMNLPPPTPEATEWNTYISWRVPVGDEAHKSFIVQLVHVTGEAAERFRAKKAAAAERLKDYPSIEEMGDAIIAGTVSWSEVEDHPGLVGIQDNAAQIGQGALANRKAERLGRTDVGVILLRNLWERELRAIAENRPPTAWKTGERLESVSGV